MGKEWDCPMGRGNLQVALMGRVGWAIQIFYKLFVILLGPVVKCRLMHMPFRGCMRYMEGVGGAFGKRRREA